MVQLNVPEGVRPFLSGVVRYHFWILAAIVPLVLVPVLSTANSALRANIAAKRGQIEAKLGDLRGVTGEDPHPNENWSAAIDADAARIDAETAAEWRRLWHSQSGLRVWSPMLGEDFVEAAAELGPGDKFERPLLIRYQNMAPRLVRELPARMGVADASVNQPEPKVAQVAAKIPALTWDAADQLRLFGSFAWTRIPSTTQIVMAQEELWVYGMFCDILAGFTKGATGGHDSPLTVVEKLAVGFPAIEAQPGGAGSQRLVVSEREPETPGDEEPPPPPPPPDPGADGASGIPRHPRFAGERQATATDDDYRSWVYVDFSGKGLTAEALAETPPMFRLMPFVLQVVIDQRQLDPFLAKLATWPIPIDVRQVRINAGGSRPAADPVAGTQPRPYDVRVELRGTVGLATPPDSKPAEGQPDAGDPAAAQAALPSDGAGRRLREDAA
jgi:hypothetical protein